MKKSLGLSLVCFSLMYGFVNPLPSTSKAIENWGSLSAIDAYQDGVGAMVVEKGRGIDNSTMNALVFKYGNEAKENGIVLGDQVLLSGSYEDKLLAGKLYPDGGSCSDGNDLTQGETWLNGICQGGSIPNGTSCIIANKIGSTYLNGVCQGGTWTNNGTPCDDLNSATTGETWLNGVCQGGVVGNVAGNGLIYDNCEGGSRNWSNAGTYCSSKGMRLPTLAQTRAGTDGVNGVPSCPSGWSWTSTPYYSGYYVWSASSINGIAILYTNGVRCVK